MNFGTDLLTETLELQDFYLARKRIEPYTQKTPLVYSKKLSQQLNANIYLKYGTKQVWLVFPGKQEIEIHTADSVPDVYGEMDTLSGGLLFPNLKIELSKIFKV